MELRTYDLISRKEHPCEFFFILEIYGCLMELLANII
jgi:hypothetical protein